MLKRIRIADLDMIISRIQEAACKFLEKNAIIFKLNQLLNIENGIDKVDENDGRVKALINYIQYNLFGSGIRHSPLTDEEFRELVRMFALI